MKMSPLFKTVFRTFFVLALFSTFSSIAHAADNPVLDNKGLLDDVLNRYEKAASSWADIITAAASWLFWTLAVISMVWTFGMMALRKADIGEFFAEFVKFTIFTGFFFWLLTNAPYFASSIYDSLRQIAGDATGLGKELKPSQIMDIGFSIYNKAVDNTSVWKLAASLTGIIMSAVVLVILALISVNMLLLLASSWILAYGGMFFLGFGGSRWTSDIAINYYKTVLGVAAQLMAMVLLIGIGKTFLDDYYARMGDVITLKEIGVILIVVLILLMLTDKVPALIAGIISGASVGGGGIGTFGAGAAVGAAAVTAAAAATTGAALVAGAASATGGAKALMAAFSKASEDASGGGGGGESHSMPNTGDTGSTGGGNAGTGDTPFAQAAGFSSSGGASPMGSTFTSGIGSKGSSRSGSSSASSRGGGASSPPGGFMASVAKAGRITANAGSILAKGIGSAAKDKISGIKNSFMDRVENTTGGRIAAAIKGHGINPQSKPQSKPQEAASPSFDENSLASGENTAIDPESEINAFVNRNNGNQDSDEQT